MDSDTPLPMMPSAAGSTGGDCATVARAGSVSAEELRAQIVECIVGALDFVLRRQREVYPFIDTKFSLITGEDFPAGDPLRGRGVVYTWIQGRGLESLGSHGRWLRSEASVAAVRREQMLATIDAVLPRVADSMERTRACCGGRLPFMADVDGHALEVDAQGRVVRGAGLAAQVSASGSVGAATSLSDLFYAKGLIAAAQYLGSTSLAAAAVALFDVAVADIRSGDFRFGQIALDPKNPVQTVAGRFSHAGRMIAIGAATLFYEVTQEQRYAQLGVEFIEHILRVHTLTDYSGSRRTGVEANLQTGDFWEFVDATGEPWRTPEGQIWSDSGHATEFVGLALAHLRATGLGSGALRTSLQQVLFRNFANGFSGLGLVKAFDLSGRVPMNTDMPWWSLPETMRAAALVALDFPCVGNAGVGAGGAAGGSVVRSQAITVFGQCWEAFTANYVNPALGFSAVQCIDAQGRAIVTIPATPDADPGYHTGLSLLGCLPWLDAMAGNAME